MGLFAVDDLSRLAHQDAEPGVPENYAYDEYLIVEKGQTIFRFGVWDRARKMFRFLCGEGRPVKLVGRVFN